MQDNTILADDPVNLVPYATGVVLLNLHSATGLSLYDKLRQVQDISTGLYRALFDNINSVTKNRVAYLDGKVNTDDMGDGRPNGQIRVRANAGVDDVRTAVMPFAVPDNSANVLANIEAMKRVRAEMGGAALDMQSAQSQLGDIRGSQGVDRVFSVMEQLAAHMTKTVAQTLVKNIFLLAHEVLRQGWGEPVPIRRNGKWESATPTDWRPRNRLTVKVGMSPGERARQANTLLQMLNSQMQLAQLGMDEVLVNATGFYKTLMQWARVNGIENPEQYFVDPESDNAQKALAAKSQQAQADAQAKKDLVNRAVGNEETKTALDKYKHDSSLSHEYWKDVLQSDIEEAKIVGGATVELLKAREVPNGSERASEATPGESAAREVA